MHVLSDAASFLKLLTSIHLCKKGSSFSIHLPATGDPRLLVNCCGNIILLSNFTIQEELNTHDNIINEHKTLSKTDNENQQNQVRPIAKEDCLNENLQVADNGAINTLPQELLPQVLIGSFINPTSTKKPDNASAPTTQTIHKDSLNMMLPVSMPNIEDNSSGVCNKNLKNTPSQTLCRDSQILPPETSTVSVSNTTPQISYTYTNTIMTGTSEENIQGNLEENTIKQLQTTNQSSILETQVPISLGNTSTNELQEAPKSSNILEEALKEIEMSQEDISPDPLFCDKPKKNEEQPKVPKLIASSSNNLRPSDRPSKQKYPNVIVCESCGKEFKGKDRAYSFSYHRNSVHTKEIKYSCTKCPKFFWGERELALHVKCHSSVGAMCFICGKYWANKPQLNRHLLTHSKDKLFTCQVCQARFKRKYSLTVHMRNHNGDLPFQCEVCTVSYPQKRQLELHQRRCPRR